VGIFPRLHLYLFAILQKIPGSGAAGMALLMQFMQKKVDERNQARKKGGLLIHVTQDDAMPRNFLDKMSDAHEQNPDKITLYHIFTMGISNVVAGSDITAISLSRVVYHLMISPQCLPKLRQEIQDRGFGHKRMTFKESQDMTYLRAVIKEASRLHPATGLPLWQVVPQGDLQLSHHWLLAGTNVGLNSVVAHYDKRVFGQDAHVFYPER
jgi:cytochrome P450